MRVWEESCPRSRGGSSHSRKCFPPMPPSRSAREGDFICSTAPTDSARRCSAGARRSCSACPSRVRSSARTCRRSAANFSTCYAPRACPCSPASECSARSSDSTPTASRSTRSRDGSNGAMPSPKHWPDSPIYTTENSRRSSASESRRTVCPKCSAGRVKPSPKNSNTQSAAWARCSNPHSSCSSEFSSP